MALQGVRVVEFAGLAPGPFAGLILADWGADVVRIDRPGTSSPDILCRNKRSIAVDVKVPSGLEVVRRLVAQADVLIDPFRPGVMERLGLGPDVFQGDGGLNKRLVFARLAGFSPTGPHKDMAGHDINYIALSGVLSMMPGDSEKPAFPLNILADFAGGGLTCALGILLALVERQTSGLGQVVNTDMVSGTRYLSSFPLITAMRPPSNTLFSNPAFPSSPPAASNASVTRMAHLLDGGAPYYNVYTCADGRWMSLGCLEPQFFKAFLERFLRALPADFLERAERIPTLEGQYLREEWPNMLNFFTKGFKLYGRDYWTAIFHGSDACALPVLSPAEAAKVAATSSSQQGSESTPMPHPQLSRTPARRTETPDTHEIILRPGQHTGEILQELGLTDSESRKLVFDGALGKVAKADAVTRGAKL